MSVEVETDDLTLDLFLGKSGELFADVQDRAKAACRSAEKMYVDGADIRPTREDKEVAREIFTGKKKASKATLHNPAVALHLQALLSQYDHDIVRDVTQLRLYVKNRLLLESDNPDAKIRLRALEMLGKIGEVGLFAERSEITVTHKSTDELEAKLHEKLGKIIDMGAVEVVEDDDTYQKDTQLHPLPAHPLPKTIESGPLRPDLLLS